MATRTTVKEFVNNTRARGQQDKKNTPQDRKRVHKITD